MEIGIVSWKDHHTPVQRSKYWSAAAILFWLVKSSPAQLVWEFRAVNGQEPVSRSCVTAEKPNESFFSSKWLYCQPVGFSRFPVTPPPSPGVLLLLTPTIVIPREFTRNMYLLMFFDFLDIERKQVEQNGTRRGLRLHFGPVLYLAQPSHLWNCRSRSKWKNFTNS